MADFKPGDVVTVEFCTQTFSTGAASNASSLSGTVNRNGTDDGAVTVTISNIDTGRYKAVFTIPATYVPGDVLNVTVAATDPNSVAGKAPIAGPIKLGVGFVATGTAGAGAGSTITLQTALGADSQPNGALIVLVSGTGAGQSRIISGYVNSTKVVTVDHAWVTNPDNTSVYAIIFADAPFVNSSGQVVSSDLRAINAVSTSSVTTINANVGTAHALTYDSNNLPEVEVAYINGIATTSVAAVGAYIGQAVDPSLTIGVLANDGSASLNLTSLNLISSTGTPLTIQYTGVGIASAIVIDNSSGAFSTAIAITGNADGISFTGTGPFFNLLSAGTFFNSNAGGDFSDGSNTTFPTGTVADQSDLTNLDVAVSSRQATFTASTGVTLPASVASPTNITAGTITTVTNLTNAPTAGDFTAAMVAQLNAATPVASIGAGGITVASFSQQVSQQLFGFVVVTGASSPSIGDTYDFAGFLGTYPYFKSATVSPSQYLWYNVSSTLWSISETVGTLGSAYFTNASGAMVGTYTHQGTATGSGVAAWTATGGVTYPPNFGSMIITSAGQVLTSDKPLKNTAFPGFQFPLYLSSDHVTPATGQTVAGQRSIDKGAYANCANAVVELANGQYTIDLAASDLNGDSIFFEFTATGCDPVKFLIITGGW